jgi:hypothetical protein
MSLLEGDDIRTREQFREAQRWAGYGQIPRSVRAAPIARNAAARRIVDPVSCPNCGAPARTSTCAYCKTRLTASVLPDPDEICPTCGELVDSDDLIGDDMRIRLSYCRGCGWTNREKRRWRRS